MPTIIVASLEAGEGRTAVAAGLAACLAERGEPVRLLRLRAASGADPAAEDDARAFTRAAERVPGCESSASAVTEQDARSATAGEGRTVIEAAPGLPDGLAPGLSAKVVLVTADVAGQRIGELAAAAETLGESLLGVVVTRQAERAIKGARAALEERGLACLGVLPEDRMLAGPTPREMAEALHASHLVEDGADDDEAVEFVMLGPLTADPGQPYFLQHGAKAVVNRFDKMDLHLAALATEPDCLILTGGQQPSPYLLDRISGGEGGLSVLLSPEGTVRTIELVDELYGKTRFTGRRKVARAIDLARRHVDLDAVANAAG